MTFFSYNILNVISLYNQECRAILEIININTKKPLFYPYSIKINRCSGIVMTMTSMTHMQNYVFLMLLRV